jgi:hypothetical protein
MTPSVPDILRGCAVATATPLPIEAAGEFTASRAGMVSMLLSLAAQESDRAVAANLAENAAIRSVFAEASAHDAALGGRLAAAAASTDTDFGAAALDAVNADLRRLLIALHEQVETAGDTALDRRIVGLYVEMARGRRLELGR